MNNLELSDILMVLFSTQIVKTYLNTFLSKKAVYHTKQYIVWIIYCLFQISIELVSYSAPLIVLIINIFLIFLISEFSYYGSIKKKFFFACILYVAWMLVEVFTNYILQRLSQSLAKNFIVGAVISKIIMIFIVNLLMHYKKLKSDNDLPIRYWISLFSVPIITVYVIHNVFQIKLGTSKYNSFSLITTILMLFINYIIFDVYGKLAYEIDAQKKNLVYEQQIALCNKQAAEREMAFQETRNLRHDLKDYLIDLKGAIQIGKIDDTLKKIDLLLELNQIYRHEIARSGNIVIDSLINYQYSIAKQYGIEFKCQICIPESLSVEGSDLCIILGNLLENACEAVRSLPSSENKHINIAIAILKGVMMISIQNKYKGTIRKDLHGNIITSKQERKNHGLGLSSVKKAVDKYHGELLIRDIDGFFKVEVLLYTIKNDM